MIHTSTTKVFFYHTSSTYVGTVVKLRGYCNPAGGLLLRLCCMRTKRQGVLYGHTVIHALSFTTPSSTLAYSPTEPLDIYLQSHHL